MILARTLKGKGARGDRREGRLARQGAQEGGRNRQGDRRAREAARRRRCAEAGDSRSAARRAARRCAGLLEDARRRPTRRAMSVATREAWGTALAALGAVDARIVALDADVKNSTFSDKFEKVAPDRFYRELHRRAGDGRRRHGPRGARRDPVSLDVRLLPHARGRLHPHGRRSRCQREAHRLARRRVDRRRRTVADGARGSVDDARASTTAPCSIRATRSAPSDSSSRWPGTRAWPTCARRDRRRRSSTAPTRRSRSADSKVVRQSAHDVATVIGAGVTVFEALKAYDQLKEDGIDIRVIDAYSLQPIDAKTMIEAARATGGRAHHRRGSLFDRRDWRRGQRSGRRLRGSRSTGSPCARFRAAASRTSSSIATASRPATSSRRSGRSSPARNGG